MSASAKDYLRLHAIVFLWGFTAILGKLITLPPVEVVFFRTGLASLVLALLLAYRKRSFAIGAIPIAKMLGTGGLIALHWVLFFLSARVSTASVCLAGMATTSLWTSFVEPIMTRRRIRPYEVVLGLVMIGGLYIIFLFEFNHALGLLLAIISALLAAVFSVINAQLTKHHNPYTLTFYEMTGATLSVALFFPLYIQFFAEGGQLQMLPTSTDWLWLGILALVCTVYAYSESVELQKRISPFALNLSINMEPIYGIALAVLLLDSSERMGPGFYLGAAIILGTVLIYPLLHRHFQNKDSSRSKKG